MKPQAKPIGLAIVVLMFRNRRTINVGEIDSLRY